MIRPILILGLAAGAFLGAPALTQGVAEVGAKPTYSFRDVPVNSLGLKSLEELRGKPVLIEFWGTR